MERSHIFPFLLETHWSCHCHLHSLISASCCSFTLFGYDGLPVELALVLYNNDPIISNRVGDASVAHRLFCCMDWNLLYSESLSTMLGVCLQTLICLIVLLYEEIQPFVACHLAQILMGVVITDRSSDLYFFLVDHLVWNSLVFTPATLGHLTRRGLLYTRVTKA